ncbi:MAG: septum formation initiator family protein [Candidatus Korobacteraceae bacterium]
MIAHLYSRRQWLATAAVVLFAGGLCYRVVFGANGMMAYRQKLSEYKQLQRQIQQSQAENEKLQQRIRQLKSDPQAIEKEAREQFRYARPGELIYVLPAPTVPNPPSAATAQKR